MFFQNYNRVRNNFVEEKKTNLTKNEEFFIKNKGNIDITTKKIMDSTMIRKPTQDRGYLVYIPQNE